MPVVPVLAAVPVELDLVVVTLLEGVSVVVAVPVVERVVPVVVCLRVVVL